MATPLNNSAQHEEGEIDIVAMWIDIQPKRLMAGALGGLTAGLVALAFAMILAVMGGYEVLMPVKYASLPILGNEATALGMTMKSLIVGLFVHELLAMILGMVYAHFTVVNSMRVLLSSGIVWGIFSWIFIFNLFSQSFRDINAMAVSRGAGFFVNIVFGVALISVGFYDRMLRGKR